MAKDDYHVIVYQILAYLYRSLKEGTEIDEKMILPGSKILKIDINDKYYAYIIENLLKCGYISGPVVIHVWGNARIVEGMCNAEITPAGIEYLTENSTIRKAYEYAKDIVNVLPIKL